MITNWTREQILLMITIRIVWRLTSKENFYVDIEAIINIFCSFCVPCFRFFSGLEVFVPPARRKECSLSSGLWIVPIYLFYSFGHFAHFFNQNCGLNTNFLFAFSQFLDVFWILLRKKSKQTLSVWYCSLWLCDLKLLVSPLYLLVCSFLVLFFSQRSNSPS